MATWAKQKLPRENGELVDMQVPILVSASRSRSTDIPAFFADWFFYRKHPTQKPLSVLSRIVLASTKKGDIVLDPFAGSSTTGIASVLFGRRYIGIDTEAEYLDISKKRYEEVSHADKIAYRGQIEGIDNTIIEAYDQ